MFKLEIICSEVEKVEPYGSNVKVTLLNPFDGAGILEQLSEVLDRHHYSDYCSCSENCNSCDTVEELENKIEELRIELKRYEQQTL